MIELIRQPWPWYVGGPMIALTVILLLLFGNKPFGISSTLRTLCSAGGAGNHCSFFEFDWRKDVWNVIFIIGIILGGIIAHTQLNGGGKVDLSPQTVSSLKDMGIRDFSHFIPKDLFSFQNLMTMEGILVMVVGGFLVGFGARYAGGCTSGHAIMGLSNLQPASLLAVIGFFIGGLIMTHLLLPFIIS